MAIHDNLSKLGKGGGAVFSATISNIANNSYAMVPITAYDDSAFSISNNVLTCKKEGTLHYLITGRVSGNRASQYTKIYKNGVEIGAFNHFMNGDAYNEQCWANGSISVTVGDTIQMRLTSEGDNATTDTRYASGMITII